MKKPKNKAHRKQKRRAQKRQQKRHIKRIVITQTALYGLPALTQALANMGNAMQKAIEEMTINAKPIFEKLQAAHQEWEQKQVAAKAYGKNHFLATNYITQSMAAGMGNNSNVGPNLVRKHRKEFNQEVVHPDPQSSHIFGSTFHISPIVKAELNNVIMDLNDNCGWTREEIANWLDTLDNQPIFYPNTCPDDCECEECKPPTLNNFWHNQGGWLSSEYSNQSYKYTGKLFNQLLEPSFSYEVIDYDEITTSYGFTQPINPIYKGTITIPHEWKMQQNPLTLENLLKYLQKYSTLGYYHDILSNSTTFELEGSQAEIKSTLHAVQKFMKGNTHELPAQSCNCPISVIAADNSHKPGCPNFSSYSD